MDKSELMCLICEQSMISQSQLKIHMRIHTEDKLNCGLCDKSFIGRSALNRHLKTHDGDKPFICDLCGKSFTSSASLRSHEEGRTHKGFKYQCVQCDKVFSIVSQLNKHVMLLHNKSENSEDNSLKVV